MDDGNAAPPAPKRGKPMNYETALTELLVHRAQPGSKRVLDWLVHGTPLARLPHLDLVRCDHRGGPHLGGDGTDHH